MIIKEQLFFHVNFNYTTAAIILLAYQCANTNRIKRFSLTSRLLQYTFQAPLSTEIICRPSVPSIDGSLKALNRGCMGDDIFQRNLHLQHGIYPIDVPMR